MMSQRHSNSHWEQVSAMFESFSDEELTEYFLEKLKVTSKDCRERVLMAITVLQAKVVETFRSQAKHFPAPMAHPHHMAQMSRPSEPMGDRKLRFILVTREAFTLVATGGVVAHQFRISSVEHPENMHTVSIAGPQPACDCPEFIQKPGFCCQHILFVYVQVLKHPHAQQIYNQISPNSRLNEPLDPALPQCILCAGSVRPNQASQACQGCHCHLSCLDSWKRAVVRVYGPCHCPCRIDLSRTRTLHAEGGTLIATPVNISQ